MKNCAICLYIRYFISFIILIIITSLLFKDKLSYFSFVTPWNAVKVIFALGLLLFFVKLIEYIKQKD
jgi:disulfide bond formation protein DsbB